MAVNHYWQGGRGIGSASEQNLYQQLVNETIKIAGADFLYLPANVVKLDELFQEDTLASFTRNYTIEMFIENYEAFLGAGSEISKFGFQLNDQLRLVVSRERFNDVIGLVLPREGDLIMYPTSRSLFEIKYVDDKTPLFPLGTRQYFVLTCEAYKYSNETIDTGTEADEVPEKYGNDGTTIKDPFAKNTQIQQKGDSILNFDESHPFGRP